MPLRANVRGVSRVMFLTLIENIAPTWGCTAHLGAPIERKSSCRPPLEPGGRATLPAPLLAAITPFGPQRYPVERAHQRMASRGSLMSQKKKKQKQTKKIHTFAIPFGRCAARGRWSRSQPPPGKLFKRLVSEREERIESRHGQPSHLRAIRLVSVRCFWRFAGSRYS